MYTFILFAVSLVIVFGMILYKYFTLNLNNVYSDARSIASSRKYNNVREDVVMYFFGMYRRIQFYLRKLIKHVVSTKHVIRKGSEMINNPLHGKHELKKRGAGSFYLKHITERKKQLRK